MASRAESFPARARTGTAQRRRRPVPPLATRRQRALFALALFTFGIASFYTSIATLTRVTPVIFKGTNLEIPVPVVQDVLGSLPGPAGVNAPGENSVFNRRINLLIIGVDKRPGYGDAAAPYNTDTLMVATMDPVSKVISVLSFPRDMVIDISLKGGGKYRDRINASYAVGFQEDGKTIEAGANHLIKDIKSNFGIDIDRWIWMDFTGVEKLIDLVGGVEVNIPDNLAVYDWYYTDDDATNPHFETFPPGINKLNGYRAVAFGRNRSPSDFDRVKRQQLVFQAAMSAIFSRGIINNNPKDLWDAYSGLVHHNIPYTEMAGYIPLLRAGGGSMLTFSLGDPVNGVPTMIPYTSPTTGASLQDWNADNVRYWIGQTFTKARYAKSTVEIQNAAGPDGVDLVDSLASFLKFDRYLPEVLVGADVAVEPKTRIVLYSADRQPMAEDIAKWIGIPTSAIVVQARTTASQPDILLVIGKDFKGTAPHVAVAP